MSISDKKKRIKGIVLLSGAAVAVIALGTFLILKADRKDNSQIDGIIKSEELPAAETMITLGGEEYPCDTEYLCPSDVTCDELLSALSKLPCLKTVDLHKADLSNAEIGTVISSVPDAEVLYDVYVMGEIHAQDEEYIDLSEMTEQDAEAVTEALKILPQLKEVVLPKQDAANNLSLNTISRLRAAAPGASFEYEYTLFGKTVTLEDTELMFNECNIGNDGVTIFYDLLPCMQKLERLVLDDCGIDNEIMADLRDAFPEKSIVWRVHWNSFSVLTDTAVIRATGTKTESLTVLKYCTEARFIDLGHSRMITDIEFARYMPKLQILIIADSSVSSIEPLSGCKELLMLEVVNCWDLDGIEALSQCTKLRFLNLSNAYKVKDLSPIFDLPDLERVYASRSSIPDEQVEKLKELHPDCWVSFGMPEESLVSCNYSIGWRLDEAPKVMAEWYIEMRKIFGIGYNLYSSQGYFSYKRAKTYDFPLDELTVFALD